MRVLLFGTYDAAAHPRVAVLAEGLRCHGVEVLECNAPLGMDTAERVAVLQRPWLLPGLLLRLATRWAQLARRAPRLAGHSRFDAVLVGYLGHFDVHLARALFRRTPLVLDHLVFAADTARDRGETGRLKQRLLSALDRAALRTADVVVVDTEEHFAEIPPGWRDKGVVVAVGASSAWFSARPAGHGVGAAPGAGSRRTSGDGSGPAPLRVVFFGLYTPLQGAAVVGQALAAVDPGCVAATMVGRGQDLATTRAAAGTADVDWRDWVESADLPGLVASHDVCLGIFGTGPKAQRVVPTKVFQGAAAGCAVVTSATAPQRRLLGQAAVLVPPGDPEELARALRRLAANRAELSSRRTACAALADRSFVPEQVVVPLVQRLRALVPVEAVP